MEHSDVENMKQAREELELLNRFTYHAPTAGQPEKYSLLRKKALDLALDIAALVPESREQALAITKLEECVFWANAGIARRPEKEPENPGQGELFK